jgi:hypothetical protein
VALNASGQPVDADGEGLPDYAEDRNGNGWLDGGETKLADPDTDYDGRSDAQERAEATDPLNPASATSVPLGSWHFNDANWTGEQGQLPKASPVGVQRVPSWRTNALQVKNSGANLKYRDVEANGSANINCRQGTVRFWFKPAWNSGQGPGDVARLLEMGNSGTTEGWWALSVDSIGRNISLTTRATGPDYQPVVVLTRTLTTDWVANQWHQIVLTHSPTASALYVDGAQVGATGSGVSVYPDLTPRGIYGFSIGSNQVGGDQAKGQFEELETFNYALSAGVISADYAAVVASAAPFAIGVFGDIQMLAQTLAECPGPLPPQDRYNEAIDAIRSWVTPNNLRVALCSGDIVHHWHSHLPDRPDDHLKLDDERNLEWAVASNAWKILKDQCLVAIAPGNHDIPSRGDPPSANYAVFKDTFSWTDPSVSGLGGHYAPDPEPLQGHYGGIQNAYWRTNISGMPFLFLTLEYHTTTTPTAEYPDGNWDTESGLIAWARTILSSYPDDLVVIITHDYTVPDPWSLPPHFTPHGQYLWNRLINPTNPPPSNPRPNVVMVLSGHWQNGSMVWGYANDDGLTVNHLYLNYQGCCCSGCGDGRTSAVARRMIVDPLNNSVTARNYDCRAHEWLGTPTDGQDGFTFPLLKQQ